MNPVDFAEANRTFAKPADMTDEECAPLRVYDDGERLLSVWEPDEAERKAIAEGGRVILAITGAGHPPVALSVQSPATPVVDLDTRSLRLQIARLTVERDQARATGARLNRRAQAAESRLIAQTKEVEAWGEDLAQIAAGLDQAVQRVACGSCGLEGTREEVAAHVLACDEHPLRKALALAQERIRTLEVALGWVKPEDAPPPIITTVALPPAVPDADEGDAPSPTTTEVTTP